MQKIGNMNYNECLSRIIRFNGDKELLTLREKYNEPSFFEIISKERLSDNLLINRYKKESPNS